VPESPGDHCPVPTEAEWNGSLATDHFVSVGSSCIFSCNQNVYSAVVKLSGASIIKNSMGLVRVTMDAHYYFGLGKEQHGFG